MGAWGRRGRNDLERLPTSINQLLLGDTVTFRFGEMRWELFPCLPIDSTTKDGTIDGEDFNELLTMRAMEEKHDSMEGMFFRGPLACLVACLLASETDVGRPIVVPWKADFGDTLVFRKRDDIFIRFSCLYPVGNLPFDF